MEQRSVVDYTLARRAVLADLRRRRVTTAEVCDANPYLLRAAKYYGEETDKSCPVCGRSHLVHVTYTFGDELGQSSGGARASSELTDVAETYAEIQVFVVEVCRSCEWNHLIQSFVIGHGRTRARARRAGRGRSAR
ncbi:MAG: DUF5318 family protein [Frankiaceae bacterium]